MRKPLNLTLCRIYGLARSCIKRIILKVVTRAEGGDMYSPTLREILLRYHKVEVGLYSTGGCLIPGNIGTGAVIGRYCQISSTARAFNANHPVNTKSSHAFFFNPALGIVDKETIERTSLRIGHDVTISDYAVITASVKHIGTGAIIGPNAVVYQDVPPYAIVEGYPARVVGYRFSEEKREKLLQSKWWELPPEEINFNALLKN